MHPDRIPTPTIAVAVPPGAADAVLWRILTTDTPGLPCRASGVNPDDWHPDPEHLVTDAQAAALCGAGSCPLRLVCLAWALRRDESGIWGGTTRAHRHELLRGGRPRRPAAPAAAAATPGVAA